MSKLLDVFLKTKATRLSAIVVSALISLGAFYSMGIFVTPSGITGVQLIFIGLLFLTGFASGIICLYHLLLKSVGEKKKKTEMTTLNIIREINSDIEEILNCDLQQTELVKNSWLEIANISKLDLTDEKQVKVLLKGLGNSLAFTYHLLNNKELKKTKMIQEKPKNWENTSRECGKKIIILSQTKKTLQKIYTDIEEIALENGADIIKGGSSTRYLVYADGEIIKLVNFVSDL